MQSNYIREVRINYHNKTKFEALDGPDSSANLIRRLFPDNSREHFISLYLDASNKPIGYSVLTGLANSCNVHPREIFQPAIHIGACYLILAHNHPSGNIQDSDEDRKITKRISDVGTLLGIKVIDHIILTDNKHKSLMHYL